MSSATGAGILALLLLIVALPLLISTDEYFRNQKLAQPVVHLIYRPWREMSFWWTLLQTFYGLALLAGAVLTTIKLGIDPFAFVLNTVLLLVAWRCFPAICLWWAYWQWDGRASLRFDRARKEITYTNREINFSFSVSEIERFVRCTPTATRAASAGYSYAILYLTDARELLVTSLLCDAIDWLSVLPVVKAEAITRRFAWLPTDSNFKKFFNPFSR
ncbi:hypothetical protein ACFST9_24315 [Hymenobacter monticola]|uniref:PH domain-containing protein n=1 Tax=Hymenobacter monticola TaxID=1705399 RepID=A0ABY4BE25_9BACT|nr:hypothetical protein [Hymenobacter monticola]UOE34900.1 hypothetical protein MTP16_04415 [Hymenobacter monticola]